MEDDRKLRFRFHREDEILLLNIVLRASPCPYTISSRDGAIMIAWNKIAEEFIRLHKPRTDGKVPYSRTCRSRCDKMIADYLAMQASPLLRNKRIESKNDRIRNELVARLSALQGKGLDADLIASAAEAVGTGARTGTGTGTVGGAGTGTGTGDTSSNSSSSISNLSPAVPSASGILTGSATGPSLMTPGQVLGRASGNQGLNESPLLTHTAQLQSHHNQQNQQQQQQLTNQQAASELLAASALLLPTTMGGIHSSSHQASAPTSTSADLFTTSNSAITGTARADKKGKQVAGSRKRRSGNSAGSEIQTQQQSPSVSTASFEALQRQSISHAASSVIPNAKRLRSSIKQSSATAITGAMSTYTQSESPSQQQVNSGRAMMGVLGQGVGSNFTGNDLTGLSNLGGNHHHQSFPDIHSVHDFEDDNSDSNDLDDHNDVDDNDEEDEEEDEEEADTGFQDDHDTFDSNYDDNSFGHELDGVSPSSQMEASTLLSFQKGTVHGRSGHRKNKSSKHTMLGDNNGQLSKSPMRNKGSSNGNSSLYRHGNINSGSTGLNFGGLSMLPTGFLQPSQLNADDRAYLMRTLALEEQRVKIDLDKVALERERLALENRRLEWKMQQMNHQ
ncbi:hypothetical protein FBU30_005658 [Linnemannia zychae]|nr:hypothetical protein FBU30_005658 [Linnemannia zychae]